MALWTSVDEEAGKPKNLTSAEKLDTYGISVAEATTPANQAKGINTPGWVKYTTYEDAQENVRHKVEVLVAMASVTGDSATDTLAPELTITVQPTNQSVTAPESATFSVTATRTGTGTITYLWQVSIDGGSTWNTASGAVATNSSFTVDPTDVDMDGHKYRCLVSLAGADTKTSNAATLTVAE